MLIIGLGWFDCCSPSTTHYCSVHPVPPSLEGSTAEQVIMEILTNLQSSYLRNNRRGGQKNLRCFPSCTSGHIVNGFCGGDVRVKLLIDRKLRKDTTFVSFTEFVKEGSEPTDITIGSKYLTTEFHSQTRSKSNPKERFIRGKMISSKDAEATYIFSYKPTCWHYSWRSNKHATNTKHFLRIFVFELCQDDQSSMTCMSLIDSTKFTLFSSKLSRKRTQGVIAIDNGSTTLTPNTQKKKKKKMVTTMKTKQSSGSLKLLSAACEFVTSCR